MSTTQQESTPEFVDLDSAIEAAQSAFWAALAEALQPAGIETGDFPPDASVEFETSTRQAGELWATWNSEADLLRSVCGTCTQPMRWINSPHGGWWAHEVHPEDDHTAEFALVDPR